MLLQERILKTLDKFDSLDQRKLSKIAGVNESSISRYLNGYETINLPAVLKIVKEMYPEQERELMAEYVLTQRSKNARFALEYCELNNLIEPSKQLIDILSVSVNPVDKEWATIYQFIRHLKDQTLPLQELQEEVEVFKPKATELKIMKKVIKAYISFVMKHHYMIPLHLNGIEYTIKEIKSDFLRDCYNIRVGLLMNIVSLYSNDLEESRHYSSLIINQDVFESVKGMAYNILGYSYIFEDHDKSKYYFDLALYLSEKYSHQSTFNDVMMNLSFLNSYWQKDEQFTLELKNDSRISNYVYYLIQKGELNKAKEYLTRIDFDSLSDWQKGFFYYYQGLIEKEKDFFYHSAHSFIKIADLLHLQLPIEELRQMGESELILEILQAKAESMQTKGGYNYEEVLKGSFNV